MTPVLLLALQTPRDPPPEADIVVIGRRGEAAVPAETEFDADEIAARGADSIGTLLDRLRPLIDETGEQPEILVNGRPLGLDRALLSYPPEALDRVAVLRREAAARYGQRGDRRVVNLVLKQRFASLDGEAGVFGSTAGGQWGGLLTARRVAIAGDTRWNATLRAERQQALLRSARDLPPRAAAPPGVDPDEYETLLPSRRTMAGSVGLARPLGSFSGALTIDASDGGGDGLRGLPPGGALRPLRSSNSARALGTTLSVTGNPGGWQTNLSANVTRSWSDSLVERGDLGTIRNKARGDSLTARLNLNKSVLTLPAGAVTAATTVNLLYNASRNRQNGIADPAQKRRQTDGGVALSIPLSRRDSGQSDPLGRLSAQVSLGARSLSGAGTRTEFGAGLIWSPVAALELRGTIERAGTAPTVDQLDGPLVTNIVRVFDYVARETVEIARLTGGNDALARGRREQLTLSAKLLPFADQRVSLNTTYRRQTLTGGVIGFPELTPAIEAAFPERVTRGADGRLLAIDARAIRIDADESAELFSSLALRLNRRAPSRAVSRPVSRWTLEASLSDRWRLTDRLRIRDGVAPIDRLADGGQSRHTLSLQATAARCAFGLNAGATWSTPTRVRGTAGTVNLRVRSPVLLNLDLFVRPHDVVPGSKARRWYDNATITVLVQNVLADYRRITGPTPIAQARDEIDPVGRSIRIVMRKRF